MGGGKAVKPGPRIEKADEHRVCASVSNTDQLPTCNENGRAVMAKKPAASSAKYARRDYLVVVVVVVVLFLARTELIEAASPRAIGMTDRALSKTALPAHVVVVVVVGLSANVIFVVDRAKLHPPASRD